MDEQLDVRERMRLALKLREMLKSGLDNGETFESLLAGRIYGEPIHVGNIAAAWDVLDAFGTEELDLVESLAVVQEAYDSDIALRRIDDYIAAAASRLLAVGPK